MRVVEAAEAASSSRSRLGAIRKHESLWSSSCSVVKELFLCYTDTDFVQENALRENLRMAFFRRTLCSPFYLSVGSPRLTEVSKVHGGCWEYTTAKGKGGRAGGRRRKRRGTTKTDFATSVSRKGGGVLLLPSPPPPPSTAT